MPKKGMPRIIHKPVFGIVQHVISRFVDGQHLMDRDEIRYQHLADRATC